MKKTVTIASVQILKTGTANGRAWSLHKFTCEDGFEFTSFDFHPNGSVEVEVEEFDTKYGKQWQETKPRKPNPDVEKILNALRIVNDKIDQILAK